MNKKLTENQCNVIVSVLLKRACEGDLGCKMTILYCLRAGQWQSVLYYARKIYGLKIPEWLNDEFTKAELRENRNAKD